MRKTFTYLLIWPIDCLDYRYISIFISVEERTKLHELNRKDLALEVRREWSVERSSELP